MKTVEFDWHNFLSHQYFNTVCVSLLLLEKSCELLKVGTKHVKWV